MIKIAIRYLLYFLLFLFAGLIIFIAIAIKPIDRSPVAGRPYYQVMQKRLDSLPINLQEGTGFQVGYAKVNITPPELSFMVGSGLRTKALSVHDSVYVSAMIIDNGIKRIALISLDMLLVPPALIDGLKHRVLPFGMEESDLYFSATHTHSGPGGWGHGLVAHFYSGTYDDEFLNFLTDKVILSLDKANKNIKPSTILYGVIPVEGLVQNRLAEKAGEVDSLLRTLEVIRSDSSKLILMSFTGHATCNSSDATAISRDYPGVLVDKLEDSGYSFAMFMAGAVGSHGCIGPKPGQEKIEYVAEKLSATFLTHKNKLLPLRDHGLTMISLPIELGEPQLRLTKNWGIRTWLFESVLEESDHDLTALRLGELILLGAPCDYSGELMFSLDSTARENNVKVMVTSFNGGYIGYITADKHYDINHYETYIMNWYGPGNGSYLSGILQKVIVKMSDQ